MIRGDKSRIVVGFNSSIQDRAVLNTVSSLESGFIPEINVGHFTTIGSGAIITSSNIGNQTYIGPGSIVQAGCVIQSDVILAAGSVVAPGTFIPRGQFWAGNPAKFIRNVTEEEIADNIKV